MGLADDLERIAALHRSGALSDAEFAQAKARCLAGADASRVAIGDAAARWLRALRRSRDDRWFGGVCGGLGARSDVPAWLWRLVFVALALCGGFGIVPYVLLWIVLPLEDAAVDGGTGSFRTS